MRLFGCVLDHIVLLLSKPEFDDLPSWLSDNFTIIHGGRHVDQPSQNKLIVFKDGTYLELFNWYDIPPPLTDEKLPMRVWGQKQPGLIDFALSSLPPRTAESYIGNVNKDLEAGDGGLGVRYPTPRPGGRKTTEGVGIRWTVTRPVFIDGINTPDKSSFPGGRLDSPFFCHDITERQLRVASQDDSKTTHPCGALGIQAVEIMVPENKLSAYAELYSKVTRSASKSLEGMSGAVTVTIGVPENPAGSAQLIIRTPQNELEFKQMQERGIGISGLQLATGKGERGSKGVSLGADEIGSTVRIN